MMKLVKIQAKGWKLYTVITVGILFTIGGAYGLYQLYQGWKEGQ